jgi:hypothetical protein
VTFGYFGMNCKGSYDAILATDPFDDVIKYLKIIISLNLN